MREIVSKTEGLGTLDMILFIFNNNVKSAFFGLMFGILFGIFPLINALFNGLVLGYVFKLAWGISGVNDFWRILPHGIFELPAIFISLGLGLKLGMFFFTKNWKKELKYRFYSSLKAFIFVVVPLLVVAAIIEGFLIMWL